MRRLVFITQAVDEKHPALAATIPKIRALAARVDELVVLALVLGRYSPAKGLPTVLEAVGQVDGVTLEIHGAALSPLEREHRHELERFGYELGGAVPRSELPHLFARSDVLVNNMRAGAP